MKSRMIGTVAAFALAVVSALTVTADDVTLPAGYTKLDYIASTGTQYINTGCQLVDRTSISMDLGHFRRVGDGENYIFGRVSGANYYDAIVSGSKLRFIGTANGTTLDSDIGDWAEKDIHLVLDGGDGTQKGGKYVGSVSISKDGGTPVVTEVETSYTVNNAYPFCVFGRAGMYLSSYRLYGMTATRPDGTAIFDLVPCIDPNGDIGVYDLVRKGFLGNGGTGRFLTPSDVNHDLVANGGFDAGSTGSAETWAYSNASGFSCPNWTLSSMVGLSAANGVWVSSTQIVDKYALFMQGGGIDRTATQTLTVTRAGDYVLTFAHAIRPGYSAGQARVELLDGSGNLVGESLSVTGEAAFKTESVLYPALAAGTYTLKLCELANSGGNSVFDKVSFCPAVQYVEEGDGLFVYDGDFSLGNVSLEGMDRILKCGTGDLVIPPSCAVLPSVRIRSGALNVQDGAATAYTVNGELQLDGGTTLKIDFADGACDSFSATSVSISSMVTLSVKGSITDQMLGKSFTLISGAGMTEADLANFALDTNVPIKLIVDGGGNLAAKVILPAGYTKLDYIASTGTQYINTGCQLVDRTSITMDLGHFRRVGDGENYIFGRVSGANYYDAIVSGSKLKFVGTANGTTLDSDIGDWAEKDIRLVLDGGDGTQKGGKYVGSVSISKDGGTPVVTEVETSYTVNNAYPFCVFGRAGMYLSSYRLYGMTATRPDGTAIFDLVPCIDPNGDIGVYDLVRKGFLGNGGTGRFLTPSDVNHDLVANGGFDAGSTGSAETWAYSNASGFSCPNWALSSMAVGLSAANGVWVSSAQIVDKYALFMQGGGIDRTATQTLTVTRAGDYVLTFAHAIRPGYSAGQARVELLDGSGNLVGESVSVTGEAAFKTESVLYPALAAGTYTLKLCEVANSGGNSAFDNVSFCPAVQYAEEGAGLFVYDGDFSLGGIAFGDKSFVIKNGTGDLVIPPSCAVLPSVRVRSGALNVQDGAATAYTLNGELQLDGGTTLKIDFADGACDSFIATGVDVSSASRENRVLIDVSAAAEVTQVANCHLLVSGAGLTADDAKKFKVAGLKGRVFVDNGDLYLDAPKGLFIVIQ